MEHIPNDPYKFDDKTRKVFLAVLEDTGRIFDACRASGISTSYIYQRRKIDEQLTADMETAMDGYRAAIEEEIRRRAMDGVVEYRYHQGMPVLDYHLNEDGTIATDDDDKPIVKGHAHIRRFSDTLLLAHARRHIPEYNEKKQVDMRVTGLEQLLDEIRPSTSLPSENDDFSGYVPASQTKH